MLMVCPPHILVGMQLPARDENRSASLQHFIADAGWCKYFASHHGASLKAETFMEGSVEDCCVSTEKLDVQVL